MLRKTLVKIRPLFKDYVYRPSHGLAKGLKRRGGLGFLPRLTADTPEERFLTSLDLMGKTVFDIGAFEGVFTLFFARKVGAEGQVITFEPNPFNYDKVLENIALNGFENVEVRQTALGEQAGELELSFRHSESGSGSLHPAIRAAITQEKSAYTVNVPVDTLDHQLQTTGLPKPDLIKIDVEGFEPNVLKGMEQTIQDCQPHLYLELHGAYLETARLQYERELSAFLAKHHYTAFYIEEKRQLQPSTDGLPALGHLYCTASKA